MTKVYVASAFCLNGNGGNKAGVVLFDDSLDINDKKMIAKRLGDAETAYVTKSSVCDYKIEYFTPSEEVDLCGHATIAAFGVLRELKYLDRVNYTIETKSGILNVYLDGEKIFMEQNAPMFYDCLSSSEIDPSFDILCIDDNKDIQIVSTGLRDILIPIKNENLLNELRPNFKYITDISKKYDVVGYHLYTFNEDRVICRNFAPLYEVNEESATGTSNCALAGLLFKKLNIKKNLYVFEQGYNLNLPSCILVKINSSDNINIDSIYVGGESIFIESREI